VALVSARQGEGIDRCSIFWPAPCRAHAQVAARPARRPQVPRVGRQVGSRADYRAPVPPKWTRRLDRVFLHPVAGPLIFALVVVAVFQIHLHGGTPLMDG
jgi:ferrous iron transport protein B